MGMSRMVRTYVAPPQRDVFTGSDFWNDPRRWEGVDDPHTTMFWSIRRKDVIDVRRPEPKVEPSPYANVYRAGRIDDMLHVRPGSLIRMF